MAEIVIAVAVAFLPERYQPIKTSSRRNGSSCSGGDSNSDGSGDGNSDGDNDNNYKGEDDDNGKDLSRSDN